MALTDNLVAYYKLDETSGTNINDEVNNYDGTAQTGVTVNQGGKIGKSVQISSASGGYILLPDNADLAMGTSDFSVVAWVNPTSFSSSWRGILGSENEGMVFGAFSTSGTLYMAKNGVAGSPSSGLNLGTGSWQFVALVFDSTATTNNATFYLGSGTTLNNASVTFNQDFTAGAASMYLGSVVTISNPWNGYMDEVGIWKRKLTSQEVTDLFNGGSGTTYPFITGFQIDAKLIRVGLA